MSLTYGTRCLSTLSMHHDPSIRSKTGWTITVKSRHLKALLPITVQVVVDVNKTFWCCQTCKNTWLAATRDIYNCKARFPSKRNRLRLQAANHGCHCFDRASYWLQEPGFHPNARNASDCVWMETGLNACVITEKFSALGAWSLKHHYLQ